ncbi:hypothetical protein ACSBR2_013895 [Camellia fascicularis]
MSITGVWFGSSVTPQPNIVASLKFRTKPKSLKLHASSSLFDFPLASKIMVKNLSYSTTETCLRKEFSNFCQIAEVKLVMDEKAKRSKGYAFIQYTSQDDALLTLESMDHKYFDGRVIFVELAKPGHNVFGVYSKTTGPPQEQNIANQDEAMEGVGVSLFRFLFGLQSLQQDTCWHGHVAKTHMCDVKKKL